MKNLLLFAALLSSALYSFAQDTLVWKTQVRFPSNSSALQAEHPAILQAVCDSLPKFEYYTIYLSGHSDSDAGNDYNRILSEKRMLAVKEVLEKCVLENTRIHYTYYGEEQPIADNKTAAGKALNRRTEVEIRYLNPNSAEAIKRRNAKNAALVQTQPVAVPPVIKERIFTAPTGLGVKAQCFTIDNFKDTMLVSKAGAVYIIPAKALNTKTRYVEYCIKEATKPSEMILEGLTTTSNGDLLQSAGMWKIEANDKGKALQLAPNKSITVAMPSKQPLDSDMKLWDAEHTADGGVNWINSNMSSFVSSGCWGFSNNSICDKSQAFISTKQANALKNEKLSPDERQKKREAYLNTEPNARIRKTEDLICQLEQSGLTYNLIRANALRKSLKNMKKEVVIIPVLPQLPSSNPSCLGAFNMLGTSLQDSALKYGIEDRYRLLQFMDSLQRDRIKNKIRNSQALNTQEFEYYLMAQFSIGLWTNIDKFLKLPPEQATPLAIKIQAEGNLKTFIFIPQLRGNYPLSPSNEKNIYRMRGQVPKNEPIWIVSIGQSEGKYYLGMAETKASDKVFDLEMKPCKDVAELEQRLSVMD